MTTPAQYRQWATMYRDNGEEATADICEIQAQEAERLQTIGLQAPQPRVVITKDGPQALLPTFDPPPVVKGNAQQTSMF